MKRNKHLYIHVPFCKSICFYCDFTHRIYDKNLVNKWLDTLALEIQSKLNEQFDTIYIGGGTPTALDNDELIKLLSLIKPYSNKSIEYTIEVNPETIDEEKVKIIKSFKINRVSIGAQTSDDNLLKSLNRKHNFDDVKNTISLFRKYDINNISIDLMYSLPNQTIDILNKTLDDFIALKVPHLSLYALTIEDNTVFKAKNINHLSEDLEADMYDLIISKLSKDYIHYEVSNFAYSGYESKHNLGYWNYDDFIGISLGASSKINDYRYTNTTSFNDYFKDFNNKFEEVYLNKKELMFENIMMSLRTIYGLDIKEFEDKYQINFKEYFKDFLNDENLQIVNNHLVVKNLAILNSTLIKFMEYLEK